SHGRIEFVTCGSSLASTKCQEALGLEPYELRCSTGRFRLCLRASFVQLRTIMDVLPGGRLVAAALRRHGVTHLFTLCGGHIQAIYDGCLDERIRVIDVRHEQTAGHAADGYARVTGRPGVCAVTAGPGVTDVVTALANAQRAQVPLLCIGGAGP